MNSRKRKLVFIILLTLSCITVAIVLILQNNSNKGEVVEPSFSISGLDDTGFSLTQDSQRAINSSVENYLSSADIDTSRLEALVRDGSYNYSENEFGAEKTLLVDIPSSKRTYKVSIGQEFNGSGGGSIYILCPSSEELRYGEFECKDDLSE